MKPFPLFFLLICFGQTFADIKSTKGQIGFDSNNDNQNEATLTNTGLGIGTTQPSSNLQVQGNALISTTLSIGENSSSSNLHIGGTYSHSFQNISDNATLGSHVISLVDSTSGDIELNLPTPSQVEGQMLTIKKITNSNRVTIDLDGTHGCNTHNLPEINSGTLPYVQLLSASNTWHTLSRSEEVSWTPSTISNLVLWIDASTSSTTLVSGNTQQINDLSGNDYHLSESTTTDQPVFNGNSISFSDSDILATPDMITSMSNIAEYRLFMVAREDVRQNNNFTTFSTLTGASSSVIGGHMPWSNGSVFFDLGNNAGNNRLSGSGITTGDPFLIQYVNSVGSSEHALRINGDEKASNGTTFTYALTSATLSLGTRGFNPATTLYEVILCGQYLSPCDAERVEGYLAWKWGLQNELPSDHTYKSQAPQD